MYILITQRFQKQYYKYCKKHFTLADFAAVLQNKAHTLIDLHFPFFKHKGVVNGVHIRSIVFYRRGYAIVPLVLALKKDKTFGENINWKAHKEMIRVEYERALDDLENGHFEVFR